MREITANHNIRLTTNAIATIFCKLKTNVYYREKYYFCTLILSTKTTDNAQDNLTTDPAGARGHLFPRHHADVPRFHWHVAQVFGLDGQGAVPARSARPQLHSCSHPIDYHFAVWSHLLLRHLSVRRVPGRGGARPQLGEEEPLHVL